MLPSWWVTVLFTPHHVKVCTRSITRGPTASRCRFEQVVGTALGWTMNRKYIFFWQLYDDDVSTCFFTEGSQCSRLGGCCIELKQNELQRRRCGCIWRRLDDRLMIKTHQSTASLTQQSVNTTMGIIFQEIWYIKMSLQARNYEPY